MSVPTIEELKSQIMMAPVTDMEPHIRATSFLYLSEEMDLAETAHKMALNDAEAIQELLSSERLVKADLESYENWKNEKVFFNFLIVQPFVLAQKAVALAENLSN
jgi:hypothetical protein